MKLVSIGLCIFGLLSKWSLVESYKRDSSVPHCKDFNPQNSLDIEHIMGMWYGIEVIDHHDELTDDDQQIDENQCIIFHLSAMEDTSSSTTLAPHNTRNWNRSPDETQHLKLVWKEEETTLEYVLKFNNSRRGYWMSSSSPRTNLLNLPKNQYIGTVQVMKAIGNQLVLTFCQAQPDNRLFSVILARQPQSLAPEETNSIHNLLERRGIHLTPGRKICKLTGASTTITPKLGLSLLLIVILVMK